MKTILSLVISMAALLLASAALANEYPGRAEFPELAVIELEELYENRQNVIIVDTRTDFEYNIIHIKDAVHVNFESPDYLERIRELRKNDARKLVFYCNGVSCIKAFRAHDVAVKGGVTNTATFDAGVFTWARSYPDEAVLVGESPVDPAKLIPREAFLSRLVEPGRFAEKVGSESLVIDVRDESQREATRLFPLFQVNLTLDDPRLQTSIKGAASDGKPVLIYDYTGEQVRWVQYLLESLGVSEYYFLKGGFRGFLDL